MAKSPAAHLLCVRNARFDLGCQLLPSTCPQLLSPVVPQIPVFLFSRGLHCLRMVHCLELNTAFSRCHDLNLVVSYRVHLFHLLQRSFETKPLGPSSQHGYEWDEWDGDHGHG